MPFTDNLLIVVKASTGGAAQEFNKLERAAQKSGTEVDTLAKRSQLAGTSIKQGLVAGATALVGVGLARWAVNAADAFVEAQDAAAQFARATGATVEEAGKFTTVARALGLDLDDLVEITAEFGSKIREQPELLDQLGVSLEAGASGSVNLTTALTDTLIALGEMPDGAEAARLAFQVFGEEGAKQLSGLYLSGIDLQELLDRIDFTENSETALKFRAATLELDVAFQQFQQTLGERLVPALTAATDFATQLVTAVGGIPGPLAGANLALLAGAVAWSRWGDSTKSVLADVRSAIAQGFGKTLVEGPLIAGLSESAYQQSTGRVREYYDRVWALRQGYFQKILAEKKEALDLLPPEDQLRQRNRVYVEAMQEASRAVREEALEIADSMNLMFTGRGGVSPAEMALEQQVISPVRRAKDAYRDLGREVGSVGTSVRQSLRSFTPAPLLQVGDAARDAGQRLQSMGGVIRDTTSRYTFTPLVSSARSVGDSFTAMSGKVRDAGARFEGAARVAGRAGEAMRATGVLVGGAGTAMGNAAATGVRSLVGAVGGVNLALIGVTAATTAYGAAAANAEARTKKFAAEMRSLETSGATAGSALATTATKMLETSSYWERFIILLNNSEASLAQNPNVVGRAVQAAMEAAAEGYKNTEDAIRSYEIALEKAREEAGEYGVAAAAAALEQDDLNQMLAKGEYTSEQLADAVRDAADAQAEKNRVDELSKGLVHVQNQSTRDAVAATREKIDADVAYIEALDGYEDALDGVVEAQKKLNDVLSDPQASDRDRAAAARDVAAAQREVQSAALDAADAWADQRRQADELAGVYRDASYYTNEAVAELERLKAAADTPAQAEGIQSLIDQIREAQRIAGEPVYIPLSVEEIGSIEAKVADLKARSAAAAAEGNWGLVRVIEAELWAVNPATLPARINEAILNQDWALADSLTQEYNAWAAGTGLPMATLDVDADTGTAELKIGALTSDEKNVTVNVTVDGVDGATKDVEALAVPRESKVTFDTGFEPGGYNGVKSRVDYLARTHRGLINIDTKFSPGGYLAVKSRVDYLARNRTATLTINQTTVRSTVDADTRQRQLLAAQQARIPSMYASIQPMNVFKVAIDGQPLKAWIRSEVAAAQPRRMEVA